MKKHRKTEAEKLAVVMSYRPIDDAFFEKIIEDPAVAEELLQVILDNPLVRIKRNCLIPQKSIKNLQGRSVRLDAYIEGADGTVFNVEVQRADNCNHAKRVRYNSSVITANKTEPGDTFDDVQELYVIYISEKDILNTKRTIVHAEQLIMETGQVLDDGLHVIYVNTEIKSDTKVSRYMDNFLKPVVNDNEFPYLSQRVASIKNDKKEVNVMNKAVEEYAHKYAQEYAQEAAKENIENLAKNGASLDLLVASFPQFSKDDIQAIFNHITNN